MSLPGPVLGMRCTAPSFWAARLSITVLPTGAPGDEVLRCCERRTAREARATLTTILNDAIPRYIQANPAARKRGKGRKGQRRIERAEKAERSWATPLEVLLFAERCAVLSGRDADFVLAVTMAYTGMRWSEAIGLPPGCVHKTTLGINRKLYELNSRSTEAARRTGQSGPPICHRSWLTCWPGIWTPRLSGNAPAGIPKRHGARETSSCSSASGTRTTGARTTQRGSCGRCGRLVHEREGPYGRTAAPVLVDSSAPWPGLPLSPWPPAAPNEPYTPPTGRGIPRLAGSRLRPMLRVQPHYSAPAGWHAHQAQGRRGALPRIGATTR